jgi:hypothetical protein
VDENDRDAPTAPNAKESEMSQPVTGDPANPAEDAVAQDEGSGRFVIGDRPELMVPPADESTPVIGSLDEVQAIADEEIVPVATPAAAARASAPPPVPPEIRSKSLAPRSVAPRTAAEVRVESALEAHYASVRPSDRAEPQIEDLSLRLDNPFASSSLMPPPPRAFPWGRVVGGAAAVVVVAVGAYLLGTHRAMSSGGAPGLADTRAATLPASTVSAAAASAQSAAQPGPAVPAPPAVAPAVVAQSPEPVAPAAAPAVALASPQPAGTDAPPPGRVRKAAAEPEDTAQTPDGAPVAAADKPKAESPAVAAPSASVEEAGAVSAQATADKPAGEEPAAAEAAANTESAAAEAPALPDAPTREQIMEGFEAVRGDVQTCAAGGHGLATTNVTIAGAGRVTAVVIEGVFAGTPQGSCMARAVRRAKFPPFAQPTFKVSYPFSL